MSTNYLEVHKHLEERLIQFGKEMPGPMTGFARLHKRTVEDGALSSKIKELMALAISVAVHCEGCIVYHVHDAVAAGATRQELLETLGVGLMMSGGPGSMYVALAMDAIDQFLPPTAQDVSHMEHSG
jgi:AhpD family alkylhydroperoxidase